MDVLDHTFLNSPMCKYFIDKSQGFIEDFIENLTADETTIEILECYLFGM